MIIPIVERIRHRASSAGAEAGIAAVTVLLVIAVLGSLGTLVLFSAQEDLRFGVLDTAADRALNRAEAGLDAAAEYLFLHGVLPSQTCVISPPSGTCFKLMNPTTGRSDIEIALLNVDPDGLWLDYRVRSSATVTGARRHLQQVMRVDLLGLPFGMFIRGNLDLGGTPKLYNESILVEGNVTGRDKVSFDVPPSNNISDDKDEGWIFHSKYIKTMGGPGNCGSTCLVPAIQMCGDFYYVHINATLPVACAGVFAKGQISITAASQEEHPTTPDPLTGWKNPEQTDCGKEGGEPRDCTQDRDSHQQNTALNPIPPVVDLPKNLLIVQHLEELKRVSEDQGLYFDLTGGGADNVVYQPCDLDATTCGTPHRHFPKDLVFFWDADSKDTIKIKANVTPEDMDTAGNKCPTDFRQSAAIEEEEKSARSGIVIVRGGATLEFESGLCWSGAVFNPDGDFKVAGGVVLVGTVTSRDFRSTGTNTIKLESSWFGRIPAGFRNVQRSKWVECEKFAGC